MPHKRVLEAREATLVNIFCFLR